MGHVVVYQYFFLFETVDSFTKQFRCDDNIDLTLCFLFKEKENDYIIELSKRNMWYLLRSSSESFHFNFNEFSVINCKIYPRTLQIALQRQLCRQQMMCYLKFLLNHQASANFFSWFIFHAETIFFGFGFDAIDFWFR